MNRTGRGNDSFTIAADVRFAVACGRPDRRSGRSMRGTISSPAQRDSEEIAMKLYDGGRAPNPRRVRIFLAEKGIAVPYRAGRPRQIGTALRRIYRDQPDAACAGAGPRRRHRDCRVRSRFAAISKPSTLSHRYSAAARSKSHWSRCGSAASELHLLFPVAMVFQHLHPAMKIMVDPQVAAWGEANKPRVTQFLRLLDGELKDRPFVVGADYTVADITAMVAVDFMRVSKLASAGRPCQREALARGGLGAAERCRLMSRTCATAAEACYASHNNKSQGGFDAHTSCALRRPPQVRHLLAYFA